MHTFTHSWRCLSCRATASSSGAVSVRCLFQGQLDTPSGGSSCPIRRHKTYTKCHQRNTFRNINDFIHVYAKQRYKNTESVLRRIYRRRPQVAMAAGWSDGEPQGGGGGSVQTGLLHDPQELLLVDLPVPVSVRLVDHLLKSQNT